MPFAHVALTVHHRQCAVNNMSVPHMMLATLPHVKRGCI
jgi:hypothetical protein